MRKKLPDYTGVRENLFYHLLLLLFFSITACLNAQIISVQGNVTASRYPVKNASVTFIDNSDSTKKFSALTNNLGSFQISVPTSVLDNTNILPTEFELEQSYPNPFSSSAAIPYKLKKESDVQVTIYDILGRSVRKFNAGFQTVGSHNLLWDGRNNFGQRVASGIYFYRLQVGGESQVKKMIFNETGKGLVSLPRVYSSSLTEANKVLKQNLSGGRYTIRIESTSNTSPSIVPQKYENVLVQRDTTFYFTTDYIPVTTVNLDSVHQYIRGFGGANILQWRPDMTADEVNKAFGSGPGQIGLSILRLRVPYDLTPTALSIQIPTAKLVNQLGGIVFASPWTPPVVLKTSNDIVGGELKENSYADFATHLKTFADYMAANEAPLYGISIQNEPDFEATYESCDWNAAQFIKFLRENAPSVGTKIIAPESFQFRRQLSDPILNDSAACANLSVVGGHIYGGGLYDYPLARSKGKEVWMTEHITDTDDANLWSGAMIIAKEINDCMLANFNAYIWWYIVRFYGPISEDSNVSKRGYVMSQFARFVRPGFYRVESNVYPPLIGFGVNVSAYKDPVTSKLVIVAVNTSTDQKEQVIRIQNGLLAATFSTYTTSESKNCEQGNSINVIENSITVTLEPSSVTTFVSN